MRREKEDDILKLSFPQVCKDIIKNKKFLKREKKDKRKKKKNGKRHRTAKAQRRGRGFNKCDRIYTYTYTPICKINTVQQK